MTMSLTHSTLTLSPPDSTMEMLGLFQGSQGFVKKTPLDEFIRGKGGRDRGLSMNRDAQQVPSPASGGRPADLLDRIFGEPRPLRTLDLLPPDQPLRPVPPIRRWRYNGLVRLLAFAAILVVGAIVVGFGATVVLNSLGMSTDAILDRFAGLVQVTAIVGVVLAYWLVGRFVEQRRPLFELAASRAGRGLLCGLGLGVVLMLGCATLLGVLGVFRIEGFNAGYSPWAALLSLGFSAAITEEIAFRGILFRLVEGTLGSWIAIAVSALVFGAAHLGNPEATWFGAIGIALEAGVLFAALYAFTRSLWTVMGLHFAWNVVQGPVLGIVVSGSSAQGNGFVQSSLLGPAWLSGGQFGIEASAVTIVVLTALGGWLLVELARRGLIVQPFWVRHRLLGQRPDLGRVVRDSRG